NIANFNKTVSLDQIKSARHRVKGLEYTQHLEEGIIIINSYKQSLM
ncbi:hypothetical protein LB213_13830, partial [Staphylococcus epidermidis]|nr:hypothetical protein [Staphylococcus epidermidis]